MEINTIDTRKHDMLKKFADNSPIGELYFSKQNIYHLQKLIKKAIFIKTNGKYSLTENQDENDLLVAMRAVFLENCTFNETELQKQVIDLNKFTLSYILPDMITQIKQHYEYIKEINSPIKPIMLPLNVNNGKQVLPAFTSLFH